MRIVVMDPTMMADEVKGVLKGLGTVVEGPFADTDLGHVVEDCDVLVVRLGHFIGEDLMRRAPQLRFIVTATTGLDHIDEDRARAHGIRIISLRDCRGEIQDVSATAEHTWGLLLALIRRVPAATDHVLKGGWDRNRFWGSQLRGKRLGIIGYGRIGAMVAGYGAAFGMTVGAYDRDASTVRPPARFVSLDDLMSTSDVISVHITSGPENRHFVDGPLLAKAKPGAFLLNTARGAVVDGAAAAEGVVSGRLAGVAVDVLEGEEHQAIASDPLLACARAGHNVLVTPHIGGATRESIARAEMAVIQELARALS